MKNNIHLHHRRSIRLKDYDYSQEGAYFITICMKNMECSFGSVEGGEMKLNAFGNIASREIEKTEEIRKNVEIDCFVVMPNHVHIIVVICDDDLRRGTVHRAPTVNGIVYPPTSLHVATVEQFGKPTSNSIPTIIRSYKATVTKQINELRNFPEQPVWQRNYYEHIIRNEEDLNRIREYITNNPSNWENDDLFMG